ncbi:hypothetical protein ACO03V_01590 [Microbacterium sp. HMH0099]|uniref:hypothetical protein n=1 Tax=Microbacterium sp. HMH0099 TaxID=3414026 RepID=UPI003BF69615
MDLNYIPAIDHARAAQLAVAVLDGDDAMAADAINAAGNDDRQESVSNLLLVAAKQLVDVLSATMGREKAGIFLRTTLAQLRAAENERGES